MLLQVREAFSVQQSQGLDTLMAGLDPQALDLLKVCHLHSLHFHFLFQLNVSDQDLRACLPLTHHINL